MTTPGMTSDDRVTTYELVWRNKWLTAEAKTIQHMIDALQQATDDLRAMKARGVTLHDDGSQQDDFAFLLTDDAAVAEEFGFLPVEPEADDDEA